MSIMLLKSDRQGNPMCEDGTRIKPIQMVCHTPGCKFVASAQTEGRAIKAISAHVIATHRPSKVVGPGLPGVSYGRTWGDVIAAMHELGVRVETPIAAIEFGFDQHGIGRVCLETKDPDGLIVREVVESEVA